MVEFIFVKLDLWNSCHDFIAMKFDDPQCICNYSELYSKNMFEMRFIVLGPNKKTRAIIDKELGAYQILYYDGRKIKKFIKNPTYRLLEIANKNTDFHCDLIKLAKEHEFKYRYVTIKEKVQIVVSKRNK